MVLIYKLSKKYEEDRAKFRKPIRLGSYAVKKFLKDSKCKRSLVDNVEDFYVRYSLDEFNVIKQLDLKEGFEDRPDDELYRGDMRLDELLEWIINNKELFLLKDEKLTDGKLKCLNTDFVAFRGCFSFLLNVSYDFKTEFTIHVEKFKGTYYVQLEKQEEDKDEQNLLYCYAGRRFEVYLSKDFNEQEKLKMNPNYKPKSSEEPLDPLNNPTDHQSNKTKYANHTLTDLCFVYRTRLNGNSLVYGAEMDSFENVCKLHKPLDSDLIKSVELKTSKKITNERQETSFKKFKALKWYNQSFLTNIKKMVVGWHQDLVVDDIKEYKLEDLIDLGEGYWSPNLPVYQLNNILSFIKHSFNEYNTNRLKFTYKSFSYQIVCDDREVKKVLPEFYTSSFI